MGQIRVAELLSSPGGHANHRVLGLVETVVRALGLQQFGVRAVLHDLAVVDVEDLVRVLDGGQPVGDDEARATLEQMPQAGLQRLLGAGVDVRGPESGCAGRRAAHARTR